MRSTDQTTAFQSLVLSALWLILLRAYGRNPARQAGDWRANAIAHMDEYGNPSEEAKAYRRETTFPPMYL